MFDSDAEAKQLYYLPEVKRKIVERLGPNVYLEDGTLDRRSLASRLFSDACVLGYVESVLYPVLNERFDKWTEAQEAPFVLYESALIFEKHLESMFDAIIVVAASEPVRIRRVITRDHCSEEQLRSRMALQLPQAEKVAKADYVIVHEEDDEDEFLKQQVGDIYEKLSKY